MPLSGKQATVAAGFTILHVSTTIYKISYDVYIENHNNYLASYTLYSMNRSRCINLNYIIIKCYSSS